MLAPFFCARFSRLRDRYPAAMKVYRLWVPKMGCRLRNNFTSHNSGLQALGAKNGVSKTTNQMSCDSSSLFFNVQRGAYPGRDDRSPESSRCGLSKHQSSSMCAPRSGAIELGDSIQGLRSYAVYGNKWPAPVACLSLTTAPRTHRQPLPAKVITYLAQAIRPRILGASLGIRASTQFHCLADADCHYCLRSRSRVYHALSDLHRFRCCRPSRADFSSPVEGLCRKRWRIS